MKQLLLKGGLLCLMSLITCLAWADETTALWDWQNDVPEGIKATAIENGTGTIESTVDGITMYVDASSGKLNSADRYEQGATDAQFNSGTIIRVPVVSTSDVVTVVGYPNYSYYTIGGGDELTNTNEYTATDIDVNKYGYVEIVSTSNGSYLYSVSVTYASDDDLSEISEDMSVMKDETYVGEESGDDTDADEATSAVWDWQHDNPAGIWENTDIDGTTGYVDSNVEGIQLYVDATSGKLNSVERYEKGNNDVHFTRGAIIYIPVRSKGDVVTVTGYPSYSFYYYGDAENDIQNNTTTYTATAADAADGYVKVTSSDDNTYLYGIRVDYASTSLVKEKPLYTTSFTEWDTFDRKTNYTTGDTWSVKTNYSHEDLTFELHGVGVDPEGTNSKFENYVGYMITAKYTDEEQDGEPYAITSPLASITKIILTQCATGGTRGIKVSVKGDGDDDWVIIHNATIGTAAGEELTLDVNRTNCQIKFEAFTLNQNAYVTDLAIYGKVDYTNVPQLESFDINGDTYYADDIFEEDADLNMAGNVYISETAEKVSESNPLTNVTASNGEVSGDITYEETEDGTLVTINVALDDETTTYKLTVGPKPKYTLYYINTDGETVLDDSQIIEEDATIGEFLDLSSSITVEDGYAFRGWYVSADGGRKYTEDEVITGDTYLYAVATEIETQSTTARYTYDLTNQYFYAEDHEAFNPNGGYWHDTQHGWAFSTGESIDILVGGHAYISMSLCLYANEGTTITLSSSDGTVIGSVDGQVSSDGASASIEYTGSADVLTLTIDGGTVYIHTLIIANVEDSPIEKNEAGYYVVNAGDADHLLNTLDMVNSVASTSERTYVFIPDGDYDLGNATLTPISGPNISIIGQSMENTIIRNTPETESIDGTATFLVTGDNCYIQDLTLKNEYPYYTAGGSAGRAVCLQDKATHTICKNVRMLSYQDTYYSQNGTAEKYFENSEIHGTVDFICGDGAVYFNECTLVTESRSADGASGECTITAPNTATGSSYGYVFNGCTIENYATTYNFGRAWNYEPRCVYLNTTLKDVGGLRTERWNPTGMNNTIPTVFGEYGTLDADGNDITPSENYVSFNSIDSLINTIITADEAAEYTLEKVFPSWTPAEYAAQLTMGDVTIDESTLTWDAVDDALAYAVFNNDELVDIISGTSYTVTDGDAADYTVRAANQYGGFGEVSGSDGTTGISNAISDGNVLRSVYYNLQGARVSSAYKGIVIKVDTMEDGTQVARKQIK
ncbi:MAG: pectinesterase family protein [Prevotella sp.]|nr:pectinesterase family protein [Prevotella sp.]